MGLITPYPVKLAPFFADAVWGGSALISEYHKAAPGPRLAESWEASALPGRESVAVNGLWAGAPLSEIWAVWGDPGPDGRIPPFPILVKLLDAEAPLSVQVHPDAAAAAADPGAEAKTEAWLILQARPGAQLVYGLRECVTETQLRQAAEDGTVEHLLNFVPVQPGDVFFLPAGRIHALGGGILLAEVQQASATTYRLYDYGRPRPLQIEQAIRCAENTPAPSVDSVPGGSCRVLVKCPFFSMEELVLTRRLLRAEQGRIVTVLDGQGQIGTAPVRKGDTLFLPRAMDDLPITGSFRTLCVSWGSM